MKKNTKKKSKADKMGLEKILSKKVLPFLIIVAVLILVAYFTGGFGGIIPGFSPQGYSGSGLNPTGVSCEDSDGGVDADEFGIVTYGTSEEPNENRDRCNNNRLVEYYCEGVLPRSRNIDCEYGCLEGRCLKRSEVENVPEGFNLVDYLRGLFGG